MMPLKFCYRRSALPAVLSVLVLLSYPAFRCSGQMELGATFVIGLGYDSTCLGTKDSRAKKSHHFSASHWVLWPDLTTSFALHMSKMLFGTFTLVLHIGILLRSKCWCMQVAFRFSTTITFSVVKSCIYLKNPVGKITVGVPKKSATMLGELDIHYRLSSLIVGNHSLRGDLSLQYYASLG